MLTEKKNALHVTYPSLLPLRMVLTLAESDAPPSPRLDANEQLALKLIEKMRTKQKKQSPILIFGDIPSPYGYKASHAEMVSAQA